MYLRKPTSKEGSEVYLTLGILKAAAEEETLPVCFKDVQGSTKDYRGEGTIDSAERSADGQRAVHCGMLHMPCRETRDGLDAGLPDRWLTCREEC